MAGNKRQLNVAEIKAEVPMPEDRPASETEVATKEAQTADLQQDQELLEGFPQREPICDDASYPRYEPGIYDAECVGADIYRDPQFRAWKCRLKFSILPDGDPVYGFFHLGRRDSPHAGPRSEYRRAWAIANGNLPRKRQVLSHRTFKRKIFQVEIADVTSRFDKRPHPDVAVYSTVKQIVSKIYP